MSVLRIKTWIMTAACAGLIGLAAGDAHAFCGKLFKKKDACDPCATAPAAATSRTNEAEGPEGPIAVGPTKVATPTVEGRTTIGRRRTDRPPRRRKIARAGTQRSVRARVTSSAEIARPMRAGGDAVRAAARRTFGEVSRRRSARVTARSRSP